MVIDAAGPEVLTFEQFVGAIARAIGGHPRIVHLPPALALRLIRLAGLLVREVILSREELDGLVTELLLSHEPPLGTHSVLGWLSEHGPELGRTYASEFERHVPAKRGSDGKG